MDGTTIALAVTAAAGMGGWFIAYWSQRAVVAKDKEVADAVAGENAAKAVALEADAKAVTAQTMLAAEKSRADGLQLQLDAERKSRHALVDELAKRGLPVGDAVVDSSLDRLYANRDGDQGGSGPRSGGGS